MKRPPPWTLLWAVTLLLGAACGSGSSGDGSPPAAATPTPVAVPTPTAAAACRGPFDEGEVFLTVLELLGASSRNGRGNIPSIPFRSFKRVLVRSHLGEVEVLDFEGDAAPEWHGPIFFSSPEVAWSWSAGYVVPESAPPGEAVLLRSEDAGVTWEAVSPIAGAARRLDVVVDEASARGWNLNVNESLASFGTPGPYVFAGSIATDAWEQVEEVPVGEWLKPVWMGLGARGGRVEVVRWWPELELYDVSDPDAVTVSPIEADAGFQPTEYATYGDRGWIAGQLDGRPRVLVSEDDGVWASVPLTDVPQGWISWLDFADPEHGFACGTEPTPADPAGGRFCAFSDDGGRSWSRGDVPPGLGVLGVARSRCLGGGVASWSSPWWSRSPTAEVLATVDGGRTWSSEALPLLGDSMQMGPTVANSRTGESTRGVSIREASPIRLPPLAPDIAADAPGPILWAVGDSVAHGPAILGLLLRSDDGGRTWIEAFGRAGGSFRDVDFLDRRTGWVVGGGRILRTDDGGVTFVDQTANVDLAGPLTEARVVSASDSSHAIVVGHGLPAGADFPQDVLLHTDDGGASWRLADLPGTGPLDGACLTADGSGILIVESRVAITADAGRTWAFDGFADDDGGGFDGSGLVCSGASNLWILAQGREDETLWHSRNGGRTWEDLTARVGLVASYNARTVGTFLPSGDGWLVVEESDGVAVPVRTEDEGRTWTELPSPFAPLQHAETMAFGGNGTGVVLTTDRAAHRTTDGGASWEVGVLPEGFMPLAMDAVP
jgi:photosystem II stability/assembly factor-like uncharacterized protein